jgi:CRP-like cAMP-binding protein
MPGSHVPLEGFGEQDGIELVQRIPLFRALTFDETRRLFAIAGIERRRAGDVIVEADAMGQALYIVRRGRVRVVREGAVLGELGEGELFGEMSLVDDLFTSAAVVAVGDVELVVLPRRPFELLVASDLGLAVKIYRGFCRTLSDRLRRANAQLPAAERLAHEVR